ncbi:putative phosphomevalonate kinase [Ceratocystis lukuohia]|uniref:Phosphomevalonate kinase n=1 Tax=Ceratocystis lukuohia TaxID=2019550 RepID=A0ABR4MGY9_9PEZI
MTAHVAVSAPGKVLLAGGYLVLDREYSGLVFGLSARINTILTPLETSEGAQAQEIVVESPQFVDAIWRFSWHLAPADGGIVVTQLQDGVKVSRNPFVETALGYALTFVHAMSPEASKHSIGAAKLKILADKNYYSTQDLSDEEAKREFPYFGTLISEAKKTGLGSSAALVTSLTGAILAYYLGFKLESAKERLILHNLAQASHCAAQGKVGSGFDVAAAVFGSCKYRRFSPSTLGPENIPELGGAGFASKLKTLITSQWDANIKTDVSLPIDTVLAMFDVACGTSTVSMVKGVLKWRAEDPSGSKALWDKLYIQNERLAAVCLSGNKAKFKPIIEGIRVNIREMTKQTGMPIEPESQTKLLDAISEVKGVYGAVVPGAGGSDAISVLADKTAMGPLETFEKTWNEANTNTTNEGNTNTIRLLKVEAESDGIKLEPLAKFEEWI